MTGQDRFMILEEAGLTPKPADGRVRLAGVQMDIEIGDHEQNLGGCLSGMMAARDHGAALAVFPECALTGYCFDDADEARDGAIEKDDKVLGFMAEASRDLGVVSIVGYLERTKDGVANAVSIVGPGGIEGRYHKTHLPHLGADRFTEPGTEPFRVFEVLGIKVGLLVCYDASFPEATRLLALGGADLVVLPTNWPEEAEEKARWLPNARAYENVIYFASVNRVGTERGYRFHGMSRICDPEGKTVVEAPRDSETILVADLVPERARSKRIERREGYWLDRIAQRREDLYKLTPGSGDKEA